MKSFIYRLKRSLIIKIYCIIFIIQLKSTSNNNLYEHFYNTNFSFIKKSRKNVVFDFIFKYKFYEIERLLKRRNIEKNIKYLIK